MKSPAVRTHILFAATELTPLAKVGGLGDVAGSLPPALVKLGVDITILLPKYATIDEKKFSLKKTGKTLTVPLNGTVHKLPLWETALPKTKVPVVLFEHDEWIGSGGIYPEADASSSGSSREFQRFGLFSAAVAQYAAQYPGMPILHCNDWHVALSVPLLEFRLGRPEVPTVLTIHNLAYQGVYRREDVETVLGEEHAAAIPQQAWIGRSKQYADAILAGILRANRITTVSQSYRNEILTPKEGMGLHTFLKERKEHLVGILNGIDTDEWDPENDPLIKANYNAKHLEDKLKNKLALQKLVGLPEAPEAFLCGMVSRLAEQKGFDILLQLLPSLLDARKDIQLVILATGDRRYTAALQELAQKYVAQLVFINLFDEKTAHAIYAGSDAFLMPSRFEPCGLGQMIAMRYGTPPVARATGGLKDSILDAKDPNGNGFLFEPYTAEAFQEAIARARQIFFERPKDWEKLQERAMKNDFSWEASAKQYRDLYEKLLMESA